MTKDQFVAALKRHAETFDKRWSRGTKKDPDNWPREMGEADWMEQFQSHVETAALELDDGDAS